MAIFRAVLGCLLRKPKRSNDNADFQTETTLPMTSVVNSSLSPVRTRPSQNLFDLPQELLDIIFEHAIPRLEDTKIISRSTWNYKELRNRKECGKSYIFRPYPAPVVDQFLVSKRYFLNAAKVFISKQTLKDPRDYYNRGSSPHYNIVLRFMQTAEIRVYGVECLCGPLAPKPPMLREVIIKLNVHDLDCFETVFPWEEEFTDEQFNVIVRENSLENLAQVKKYRFEFESGMRTEPQAEREMCRLNASKFEEYVRRYVGSFSVGTGPSGFDINAGLPPALAFSSESDKAARSDAEHETDPGEDIEAKITLAQLPETAEEMIELLKSNGEEVMGLLGALKDVERMKQNEGGQCVQQCVQQ